MVAVLVLSVVLVIAASAFVLATFSGDSVEQADAAPARPAAFNMSRYVKVVAGRSTSQVDRGALNRILVPRDSRPLWQVRGWRKAGRHLVGAYRTPLGSYSGEIDIGFGLGQPEFYILNPPAELLRGPHRACFRARGKNRFWIHFSATSKDVDSGIVAVEALLVRALSESRRK